MYGSERGTCLKPSLQTAFLFFLVYCCCSNRAESCRRKTLSPLGQNQRGVSQNRCESEYFHFYFHSPWQGGQQLPWHHSCYVLFWFNLFYSPKQWFSGIFPARIAALISPIIKAQIWKIPADSGCLTVHKALRYCLELWELSTSKNQV